MVQVLFAAASLQQVLSGQPPGSGTLWTWPDETLLGNVKIPRKVTLPPTVESQRNRDCCLEQSAIMSLKIQRTHINQQSQMKVNTFGKGYLHTFLAPITY